MNKYTADELTKLLTTDREKLTRICAEVCYGWELITYNRVPVFTTKRDVEPENAYIVANFDPLAKTNLGRSQAFELAVKFDCFPFKGGRGYWSIWKPWENKQVTRKDPQAAIVIASILTAQQENNDE